MALGRPLSGPRLPPQRGPATHLVVLCHGYGADGNDLIGLAPHWQRELPTAVFVAPNAPEPVAGAPGYQWFPITRLDPGEMQRGVEAASGALNAFLDAELARLGIAAGAPRAGRLQPGHHDGAASRPRPRRQAGGDRRLFRHAGARGRARALAARHAADPLGAWRRRSDDPGAGDARLGDDAGRSRRGRCSGTSRRASATASIRAGSRWAAPSWSRPFAVSSAAARPRSPAGQVGRYLSVTANRLSSAPAWQAALFAGKVSPLFEE